MRTAAAWYTVHVLLHDDEYSYRLTTYSIAYTRLQKMTQRQNKSTVIARIIEPYT